MKEKGSFKNKGAAVLEYMKSSEGTYNNPTFSRLKLELSRARARAFGSISFGIKLPPVRSIYEQYIYETFIHHHNIGSFLKAKTHRDASVSPYIYVYLCPQAEAEPIWSVAAAAAVV